MRCNGCTNESSRIHVDKLGRESCHNCSYLSEAGGVPTSGALTRNSFRIRRQRDHAEGDFIQPHAYDRASKKVTVNPDFVKNYADQAGTYFGDGEMVKAGYKRLPDHNKKLKAKVAQEKAKVQQGVMYEGSADAGIKRVLS